MRSTFEWVERGGGIKIGLYILPPTHTPPDRKLRCVCTHRTQQEQSALKIGPYILPPHTPPDRKFRMYVQIARSKSRMLSPKTTTSKCRKQKIKTG